MREGLTIVPLETRIFAPGEDLVSFVAEHVPREKARERMIVAVTSKIVSLAERRLVARDALDKAALVRREADIFLGEVAYGCFLTVKEGLFIPSAGIDESNSAGGISSSTPSAPTRAPGPCGRVYASVGAFGSSAFCSPTRTPRRCGKGSPASAWRIGASPGFAA